MFSHIALSFRYLLFALIRVLFQSVGRILPGLFARWAIQLWGKAERLPWRSWERAIIDKASQEMLQVDGETVCTYVWAETGGESPHETRRSILLAHGWNSRASHFKNYIQRLTGLGYRVVGFDAIGHGNSSGNWTSVIGYQATLAAVDNRYGPFHAVMGHSFGGFCIPHALANKSQPLRSARAVLIAAPDNMAWLYERFMRILKAPTPVKLAVRRQLEKRFGEDFWDRYSVPTNATRLGHIPALIVHDVDDPGVPLELAQVNHEAWPHSELLVTHKLGHHRALRHPSAVNPIIDFITD